MSKFILRMKDMTAHSEKDLCVSCSHVYERHDERGIIRRCSMTGGAAAVVRGRVSDCTDYYPKNLPSLRSLTEIAWDLSPARKGKIGFTVTTPEQRRRKGADLDIPDWE